MADQIVFLLHGMGTHTKDWHLPWLKTLEGAYNAYPLLQERPFTDRFDFVPITYDAIFREIVEGWENNAKALEAAGLGANLGTKLTKWLANAGELKDNFEWTHAADVLLYRLFSLVHDRVCVTVADEIKQKLNKAGPGSTWSIIGHSLGTSVLHDTIATMWAGDSVFARDHRARLIAMVSNVSRVLEQKNAPAPVVGDVLLSPVRPGVACNYFLNLEHPLDPFVWPRRFRPLSWPDQATLAANPPRYIHSADEDIKGRHYALDHIHSPQVHDFEHYLVSPKAHIPLFRMLLAEDGFISPEEEQRSRDRFPRFGTLGDQLAIKIKDSLERIGSNENLTWEDIAMLWAKLQKIVKAFP